MTHSRNGSVAARRLVALAAAAFALGLLPSSAGAATACYAPDRNAVRIPQSGGVGCARGEVEAQLEATGIRWRGAWVARKTYAINDAVQFRGSAFIATKESKGVLPVERTRWELLASKGDEAAAGPAGATGARGATGPAGAAGAQGPKGDAGEAGPRGETGADGKAGPTGPQGEAGPRGETGSPGFPGSPGSRGPTGATGPAGPQGPAGPGGVTGGRSTSQSTQVFNLGANGSQAIFVTPSFTAERAMSCLVIATIQIVDSSPPAAGGTSTFFKIGIRRNNATADDERDDQVLVSSGAPGRQPSATRSSVFSVSAGQSIEFAVFLKAPSPWAGATALTQASYFCS